MTSPVSGQDVTDITNVLSGLSSDADRVDLPGTLFESDKIYAFKLKVATFLNPSSFEEVTHSITKATDPVPALTLSSSIDLNEGEVVVSEDLSIKASAIVSTIAVVQYGGHKFSSAGTRCLSLFYILHHPHRPLLLSCSSSSSFCIFSSFALSFTLVSSFSSPPLPPVACLYNFTPCFHELISVFIQ